MIDLSLISAISQVSPLSEQSCALFDEIIEERHLKSGTSLLDIGNIDREFHFIKKGSGRVYYLRDGRDVTDYIAMDGEFLGGVESLFTAVPSHKGIEVTEDSIIESFKYSDFERICAQHHDMERAGRKIALFAFLECQKRIESIRFYSAAERYGQLVDRYPDISNRIPLKHIASYLGISQVSLSRIRKGIQ
ncbi:Crp/Fnr family transcriptional regulator [Paracrocinitomix mangrovi]|uniref:Crp/Fnr family transcriptional regulator n=1 Tax=Paracrocinitomix mangrovi TaxID=2862509 RepID=UPI001C8F0BBA|nr:Crp/Fnr family transcriptional regulator [Paracrocinitomix mangrovi]UKN02522.1 Crp/Fnr family transcriptional regulator [Paracrocinitomix mangrovi]